MRSPANCSFSARYSQNGICGTFGWLDQGVSEGSDITRAFVAQGISLKGGEMKRERKVN